MRYFWVVLSLLVISCTESKIEEYSDHTDCGVSPYILHDSPYAEGNQLVVNVRAVKIIKSNGKNIQPSVPKRAIARLNADYKRLGISFELKEVVMVKDGKAWAEGMGQYQKHASKYQELGYLNIFFYDNSSQVSFAGAAVGIPSLSFCVKEDYADKSTVSHEAGHCLGLYHTHTYQSKNGNSYDKGDFICATKFADSPFRDYNYGYIGFVTDNCTYVGELSNLTQEEHNKNVRNLMSYSLVKCRDYLNDDQGDRIRWIINNSENHKKAIYSPSKIE